MRKSTPVWHCMQYRRSAPQGRTVDTDRTYAPLVRHADTPDSDCLPVWGAVTVCSNASAFSPAVPVLRTGVGACGLPVLAFEPAHTGAGTCRRPFTGGGSRTPGSGGRSAWAVGLESSLLNHGPVVGARPHGPG